MNKSVKAYNQDTSYNSLCTSGEILKAIEALTQADVRDKTSTAYKLWAAPTVEQDAEIADLAWSYADEDVEQLYWGGSVAYKREL